VNDDLRGEPHDFRIPRTGDRDLAFRGWLLSHAEERDASAGVTHGVDIDIYLTIRLRLVAHMCRWSLRERSGRAGGGGEGGGGGGTGLREDHRVAAHDTAAQTIDWLKQANDGRLDAPSKRAWVSACRAWPGLKAEAVEHLD
jgi:hypothetical protein